MKVNKADKHAISDALREASKQRLQNALKQAQQRLGETKYAHHSKCLNFSLFKLNDLDARSFSNMQTNILFS